MKATKGNKVYLIGESQKNSYIKQGFDITDDLGNVVSHGAGKTVSYDKYAELEKEKETLKNRVSELEKANEDYKLNSMTVDQLKAYASEMNINLEAATTKDAIIDKFKADQGE